MINLTSVHIVFDGKEQKKRKEKKKRGKKVDSRKYAAGNCVAPVVPIMTTIAGGESSSFSPILPPPHERSRQLGNTPPPQWVALLL